MQSKKQSFIESLTNTAVGFTISLMATFMVLPLFNIKSSFAQNLGITICFTFISITRGYVIRRYFNNKNNCLHTVEIVNKTPVNARNSKSMLSGKCKEDFIKYSKFWWFLIPRRFFNFIIFRWFNTETEICIDIQHWQGDGFDYAVQHPYKNEVYQSYKNAGDRTKNFDFNMEQALEKANEIYNKI
ncbi:hypothetical protein Freya2_7 [Polaribacter phage Freya_2]|nr:hypothetical protein Freya2_7 [Polaribacter phage Freya_2]QQV91080.1 hypothetical protein Freya4_7 [Polaribacter phage Freya_4]